MYVYNNMPSLEKWDSTEAIVMWLNDKNRREHTNLMQKGIAQKQSYFKGIFDAASQDEDQDEDSDEGEQDTVTDKRIGF